MLNEAENEKLLKKRISELDLRGKVVLSFDFDELVVPVHLTREVAQKVSRPIEKKVLDELGHCSFKGIRYLQSLIYGYDFNKYKKIRDKIVRETNWTEGFDKLIMNLQDRYSVIFVSSGIKDICEAKLKEIGFNPRNILADEFRIENDQIVDSNLIISDELKGFIIKKLKENYKVVAVGHSLGDKTMLDNADVSISVNSEISGLAKYNVRSSHDVLKIIKELF